MMASTTMSQKPEHLCTFVLEMTNISHRIVFRKFYFSER